MLTKDVLEQAKMILARPGLKLGIRRAVKRVCREALWLVNSLIWPKREIWSDKVSNFWTIGLSLYEKSDGEVLIPGGVEGLTQNRKKNSWLVSWFYNFKKSVPDRDSNPQPLELEELARCWHLHHKADNHRLSILISKLDNSVCFNI